MEENIKMETPDIKKPLSEDKPRVDKRLAKFKQGIEHCKTHRRKLIQDWQTNVDYRRGKPFATASDQDRIAVPLDWSLTKEKESQLFSQVPAVRVSHPPQTTTGEATAWVYQFEQRINDTAIKSGIEAAMTEVLPDCINAAGFGSVIVAREAITDEVNMPAIDLSLFPPELQAFIFQSGTMPDGTPVPMEPMPRTLDSRYVIQRISPADFLWPLAFTGSDFDAAPWVGRSGRISWPEAKGRFGLEDKDKKKLVGDGRGFQDRLDQTFSDPDRVQEDLYEETVEFDEIFYKSFQCGEGAAKFATIHHLVFVTGKTEPVVDEPWEGQIEDQENGDILGSLKYPIRVLTLAYITDDAIPPSDSAIGRPQVDELNKSRTQQIKQRERSIPVRWFDVNRVDPAIQYSLMRGTWQGMIPVQGNGDNILGEVARSGMSNESYAIDKIVKNDLAESWQTTSGGFAANVETKGEAQQIGAAMRVRVARERAKVGAFFVGITEVLGGLIAIFEDPASFGEGFTPRVSTTLSYSILADSTVLLDSNQRLDKLMEFVNMFAKSGYVDVESIVKEAATLSGLDPNVVVRPPEPRPPVEPNISLRFTGIEDLLNPLILAFLLKSGQAPDAKLIEQAKGLINVSVTPPQTPVGQATMLDGQGGMQGLPGMESMDPSLAMGVPEPPIPAVGSANPNWSIMGRLNKRAEEGQ